MPRSVQADTRPLFVRLAALRPMEWLILLEMLCLLPTVLVLQHLLPLPRLLALYDARALRSLRSRPSLSRVEWIATGLMRRILRTDFCMKRSILLFRLLRRWGYATQIHFGVKKDGESLAGHAWVSIDGLPFAERTDPNRQFAIMYSYPHASPTGAPGS